MKKLVSLMLVLMLTVPMLAGCGGETAPPAASTPEKPAASQATDSKPVTDELKLLKELEQKNIKLVEIYNQVAELAIKNGWEADELTLKELNAANALITTFNSMIKDPASAKGADMPEILSATDDLIKELDTNIRTKVSTKYVKK